MAPDRISLAKYYFSVQRSTSVLVERKERTAVMETVADLWWPGGANSPPGSWWAWCQEEPPGVASGLQDSSPGSPPSPSGSETTWTELTGTEPECIALYIGCNFNKVSMGLYSLFQEILGPHPPRRRKQEMMTATTAVGSDEGWYCTALSGTSCSTITCTANYTEFNSLPFLTVDGVWIDQI